jgi:hypothetical protein
MDQFGFKQLAAWLAHRVLLPPGPLFCVIDGRTRGRRWAATAARAELRQLAVAVGCAGDSRPINCATLTRSSSRGRALRSTSSNAHTPISEPRRRISRALTRSRSSTPSAPADRPQSRPPPDSLSDDINELNGPPARRRRIEMGFRSARRQTVCSSQLGSARTATVGKRPQPAMRVPRSFQAGLSVAQIDVRTLPLPPAADQRSGRASRWLVRRVRNSHAFIDARAFPPSCARARAAISGGPRHRAGLRAALTGHPTARNSQK